MGSSKRIPHFRRVEVPRFECLSWQTALEIGGAVVQRKALEYAAQNGTSLVVRSLGGEGTVVGAFLRRSRIRSITLRGAALCWAHRLRNRWL